MTETFRDLIAWKKAKTFAKDVYEATAVFPKQETYGLTSQMRRAVISIPSNIAEGKGRGSKKDYCHFVMQARGSLFELETQIELAVDLAYLSRERAEPLLAQCNELGRILNGLIRSLQ